MIEDEAAGAGPAFVVLKQLLVEVLLRLGLVGEDIFQIVEEGQMLGRQYHTLH